MAFYNTTDEPPRDASAMERSYEGAGVTSLAIALVVAIALGFLFLFAVPNQRIVNTPSTTELGSTAQPAIRPMSGP